MLKKRLFITTPFLIISILSLLWILYELIIERGGFEGWGLLTIYSILPFLIGIIIVDLVLKLLLKTAVKWMWLIEGFLLLGLVYYWIVR